MARRAALDCQATCAPGLEALLADELVALGLDRPRARRGVVAFAASTRQLYVAALWSRLADRVQVRIGGFTARSFADLERRAADLPWDEWVRLRSGAAFRVRTHASKLYHRDAVAERLARAAGATRPDRPVGPDATPVSVHVERDRFTIWADVDHEPLHKRGWRLDAAKAPLRETLAAALLRSAGWPALAADAPAPLVDPFCGSGTIVIEAALVAMDIAPRLDADLAMTDWPCFEPGTWASVTGEARARADAGRRRWPAGVLAGSDRDAGAVAAAAANAARAGVGDAVAFSVASVSKCGPPTGDVTSAPGLVATNPPFGRRVGDPGRDLRNLYGRFGSVVGTRFAGWAVALLVADPALGRATGLSLEEVFRTTSGGLGVRGLRTTGVQGPLHGFSPR